MLAALLVEDVFLGPAAALSDRFGSSGARAMRGLASSYPPSAAACAAPAAASASAPRALVVAKYREDSSWVDLFFGDMPHYVYHMAERDGALGMPKNVGNEATAYLRFIVEHYDALPERIKKRLDGVKGVYLYSGRREFNPEYMKSANLKPSQPIRHLLLGTHLETGRKVLFFDRIKIVAIDGMEPAESDAMIEELASHIIQPNAQYTHKWAKGDIVIWDNRSSYHKAAGDYPVEEDRIHWRVSLKEFSSAAAATADAY